MDCQFTLSCVRGGGEMKSNEAFLINGSGNNTHKNRLLPWLSPLNLLRNYPENAWGCVIRAVLSGAHFPGRKIFFLLRGQCIYLNSHGFQF